MIGLQPRGMLGRLEQRIAGASVQRVAFVELRDQHAGVDDDHAGRSSRRRSSSPGS